MQHVSIYKTDCHTGEKQLVLYAPTVEEADAAFDELKAKLPKYKDRRIDWQYTFFDDEIAVGEIL